MFFEMAFDAKMDVATITTGPQTDPMLLSEFSSIGMQIEVCSEPGVLC